MHLATTLLVVMVAQPPAQAQGENVILLTLDGVRWQDFFRKGADASFPLFWAKYAAEATIFGDPETGERFEASTPALLSLPAYQELLTGRPVPCETNECGPVEGETLVDALVEAGFQDRVRVVASWARIAHAASAKAYPFVDTGRHEGEPAPPWHDARFDRETWARAMAAVARQPKFLWVSLNDADEWAHRGARDNYQSVLRKYDRWLDELVTTVRALGAYGAHTTILVTTDHGRGEGADWTHHGAKHPGARAVFAFALGPGTGRPRPPHDATHRALRPTMEALLGLRDATPLAGVLTSPTSPPGQAAPSAP